MSKDEQQSYINFITSDVLDDARLDDSAKLLFVRITGLAKKSGFCFASDEYLAQKCQKSERSIQRYLNSLVNFGYIQRVVEYYPDSKKIKSRHINISRPLFNGDTVVNIATDGDTNIDKFGDTNIDTGGGDNKKRMSNVFITEVINRDFKKNENLTPIILEWCDYKRSEKKKPYKTEKGLKKFINHLVNLSGGNFEKAKELTDTAMAAGWEGVFSKTFSKKTALQKERRNADGFTTGSSLYGGM